MAGGVGLSALDLRDVHAVYGSYKALNGLTLKVEPGESIAMLGRNGAGKSTFARVVSGLVAVSGGELRVFDQRIRRTSAHRLARMGVVHLPEGVGLFAGLSIEQNLQLRVGGHSRGERRARLEEALHAIGPLRERRRSRAGQLSGGQQRLVAISGAIAARPRLLVADEPALGLSPAASDDVYEALERLRTTNVTTIIIETRLGRVEALCPRAVVMDTGAAAFDGPIEEARKVLAALVPVVAEKAVPVAFDFGDAGPTEPPADAPHSRRLRFGRRRSST